MVYNLTSIGMNTTGLYSMTQTVNDVLLYGWGGTLLLVGFCIVIFMSFLYSTQDTSKSIMSTLFIGTILSLLLKAVDLIPSRVMWASFVLCAVAVGFTFRKT